MNPYYNPYYATQMAQQDYTNSTTTTSPSINGSFWKGTDGNVYVYGDQGTNSAGVWDNNTVDYWSGKGYSQIADPYATDSGSVLGTSTYSSGGGSYSGGGGSTSPTYSAIDMALIDSQIESARNGLGRIGNQRDIGRSNIDRTFNNANTSRQNQFNAAQGRYDLTTQRNAEDYSNVRSGVRRDAGQQYSALQRLLGSAGAGRSSAAQILAPFAVGREAAQRFGQTEDQFGRNAQDLDLSWQSTVATDEAARKQLEDDKKNKLNSLNAGLAQSEVGLQDQLAGLELQKQRLLGGGLDDVRGVLSPYQSKVSDLLSQIDNYGKLAVSSAKPVDYTAPELERYNYSRFANPTLQGGGADPRADYVSPLVSVLRDRDEKLSVQ